MRKAVSLRTKVLLILTCLPLLSVSIFAYIAIDTFKKDKEAYIFDSNSNLATLISTQVKGEIESVINGIRPFLKEALEKRDFAIFKRIPEEYPAVKGLFVVSGETGQEKSEYQWLADPQKLSDYYIQLVNENRRSQQSSTGEDGASIFKSLGPTGPSYIIEKIDTGEANEKKYLFVVFSMPDLEEMFVLKDGGGLILYHPTAGVQLGVARSGVSPAELKGILASTNFGAVGSTLVNVPGSGETLVAYASVGVGGSYVLSLVPKAKAFAALVTLQKKVMVFLVLIAACMILLSIFATHSLLDSLLELNKATEKVSAGDFNVAVPVKRVDEVGRLTLSFNKMAKEVKRLLAETAEAARMQGELRTAKTVQETLFPPGYKNFGDVEVSGFYEPASECGGDWWHYTHQENQNRLIFWLGDATGHGAPAALITSAAKSASSIIEGMSLGPKEILKVLNRCIFEVSRGQIMMTFLVAQYDLTTHKLTYSNASHEPPFQIHRPEQREFKKKDLILLNEVSGPRLGQQLDSTYTETTIDVSPEDVILFYTDGVADVQNKEKTSFGERNLVKTFLSAVTEEKSGDTIQKKFTKKVQDFRKGQNLVDDLTFFFVRRSS